MGASRDVPRVFLGCFCQIQFALVAVLTFVYNNKLIFYKKKHPKRPLKHNTYTFESFWEHS